MENINFFISTCSKHNWTLKMFKKEKKKKEVKTRVFFFLGAQELISSARARTHTHKYIYNHN